MHDIPVPAIGVGSWIERRARIAPDRPALIIADRPISYAELASRIRRLAVALAERGVGRGDRIAWVGPNHPAFLESLFAAGLLGAALAPVNHRLAADQRAAVLADTEPAVLIEHLVVESTSAPVATRLRLLVAQRPADERNASSSPAGVDYETFLDEPADDRSLPGPVSLDDVLFLPHTSGTTGPPKGVMLTHANVTWNAVDMLTCADLRESDVTIAVAPFFRVGGTGVNVLPVLFLGGTVVIPDDSSSDATLDLIERHHVTVGFGNPDTLDGLVRSKRWPNADLSSVRLIVTGGAPIPEGLVRAFLDRDVTLVQGYGLSEAAPVVLLLDPRRSATKPASAGRPPMFVDIRIVDVHGDDVEQGATGELLVRGPNVMAGYWRRPLETTKTLLPGGWLRTGDAARMDADGDVEIVDRADAALDVEGQTIYPGDVERVLRGHPAVADVGVTGVSRSDGSTAIAAFVERAPSLALVPEDVLAFARARLPHEQVPISITAVDALPRNTVGKLIRSDLPGLAVAAGPEGDSR